MSEWVGIHCHSLQFARTSYIVFQSMMLFVVRQRNGIMAIFSYEPKPQRGHDGFQTKKCLVNSEDITKKKHKKKTKNNQKKQHMQRHPMHLAGRRCALPTKNDTKKTQMQRRPMHLSKNTTERNNKCKNTRWGEAPLTHTSRRK